MAAHVPFAIASLGAGVLAEGVGTATSGGSSSSLLTVAIPAGSAIIVAVIGLLTVLRQRAKAETTELTSSSRMDVVDLAISDGRAKDAVQDQRLDDHDKRLDALEAHVRPWGKP